RVERREELRDLDPRRLRVRAREGRQDRHCRHVEDVDLHDLPPRLQIGRCTMTVTCTAAPADVPLPATITRRAPSPQPPWIATPAASTGQRPLAHPRRRGRTN